MKRIARDNAPMPAPIYVISGVPGSGKSTVARALCARHPASLLISGDDLRAMLVTGTASPLDGWSWDTQLQFELSWRTAASMAARYADAGFIAVIDDVLSDRDLRRVCLPELGDRRVRPVMLRPSLAVATARNRERTTKDFDTEKLVPIIKRLHDSLAAETAGWTTIDNSALSVDETVERVLAAFSRRDPAS